MDNRFRREKHIGRTSSVHHEQQKHVDPQVEGRASFLRYFLDAYKRVKKYNTLRDSILLMSVLFVILLWISWALPRVFSFRFDPALILSRFSSVSSEAKIDQDDIQEDDIDILILWRWWNENDAPDLTDTIILWHFNKQQNSLISVSIPRDLLVQSKILGRVKINEVYAGTKKSLWEEVAMNHLMEIVSQITGKNIQMYAMIDFKWFRELIDAVWWIQIQVPKRLYDPEYPAKNWGYTIVDIPEGLQLFDGDKALKYARSRHTTSDFDRSLRQQLVLQALKEKMSSIDVLTSPKKLEALFLTVGRNTKTNIAFKDILQITKSVSGIEKNQYYDYALNVSCFEALRLCSPGGLIFNPDKDLFWGLSVLLPKKASPTVIHTYDMIRLFVAVVTEFPKIQSAPKLWIVNASWKTNLALSIGLKLQSIGIPVDGTQIKNQKEKSPTTFIRYNSNIIKKDTMFLQAMKLVFSGDIRPATESELKTMIAPYELVLWNNSSLYFQ